MAKMDTLHFDDFRKLAGILEKLKLEKTSKDRKQQKSSPLWGFKSAGKTVRNFVLKNWAFGKIDKNYSKNFRILISWNQKYVHGLGSKLRVLTQITEHTGHFY